MRAVPLLLIALSLALAGCSKAPTPTTPTTNATTTLPTGTSPTTPTTPTTPTSGPMTPTVVKEGSVDFTQNTPAQPLASIAITIDAGYSGVLLNVTFSCASAAPACLAANTVTVKAAGLSCTIPDGPVTGPIPCTKTGAVSPGAAKIEFTGNGIIAARYQVVET